jgi:hypothetical protein
VGGSAEGGVMPSGRLHKTVAKTQQILKWAGFATQARGKAVLLPRGLEETKTTGTTETPVVAAAGDDGC